VKREVSPAIVAVVIVIVVGIAAFLIMRGTQGGGNKAPGAVGNPGPFAPGGPANHATKNLPHTENNMKGTPHS
jgi:hypothetical protein